MRNSKPILLIEDDIADAMAVETMLADLKVNNQVIWKRSALQAIEFLKNNKDKKLALILLDLTLPDINGIEFLRTARNESILQKTPVVVLTVSNDEQAIVESFELSIAGYFVKKSKYENFKEIIDTIDRYWTFSELPCGE